MFAWEPLQDPELKSIREEFRLEYEFRPSIDEREFPGISEPTPSITYLLKEFGSMDPDAANRWGLDLMKACIPRGKRIFALDWQHFCWSLDVHLPDAIEDWERRVPILPDGDYSIFLSPELRCGLFGHPWERSLCVFGEPFVQVVRREPPAFVQAVLRQDGKPAKA